MEKLSYGSTFFFKVIFPGFWFVFVTVFLVDGLLHGVWRQPVFVVQPLVMMAFGFFLFRHAVAENLIRRVDAVRLERRR